MSSSNGRFQTVNRRGKPLPAPAREIVSNVINFLKKESENGFAIPFRNFKKRAINATGVSDKTYRSIIKESAKIERGETKGFVTPRKTPRIPRKIMNLEKAKIIRELVHNFYVTEKKPPTIDGLLAKIKADNIPFDSGKQALWRIMRKIGFQWVSTRTKVKALVESNDSRCKRIQYLKKLLEYRQQGRAIVYVDERYIDNLYMQKFCRDNADLTLKKPANKSRRLVVACAGEEMGFMPNCLLMFVSDLDSGDYYDDDNNAQQFLKWVENKLAPNLPPRSILVIDDSIYQNIKSQKRICTKDDMIEWLQKKNVACSVRMTKPELRALIETHKTQNSAYILDDLLEKYGHSVLRLPLYHPELSPISEIWEVIKDWVLAKNVAFKMEEVQHLVKQKFDSLTKHDWNKFCDHVKKIEKEYTEREVVIDKITDDLQILMESDEEPDKHDEAVNDVMEIEEISDDEPEEVCSNSSINLVTIPIKTEVDDDDGAPTEIKQEPASGDELTEISEWKPPANAASMAVKEELSS